MCVDRDCGHCKLVTQANMQRLHRGAAKIAWCGVAVFLLGGGAALVLHWLEIAAMCVGALVIGGVAGWVWVMRRLGRPLFGQPQQVAAPYRQPVAQPQYQQALPQPSVINNKLAIPESWTPADAAEFAQRMRDGR